MSSTRWTEMEAERAFARARRERRRASLGHRVLRRCAECARLAVFDENLSGGSGAPGLREIPLYAIGGTLEPNRAADFDGDFRPSGRTRSRWMRVWLAEQLGTVLPPISVVRVGDAYAVRDGHHRVSVARARGALAISAVVA
jgi:hypothetical protein